MSRAPLLQRQIAPPTSWWAAAVGLILMVLVFAAMRAANDVPHLADGTVPEDDSFDRRYVLHPVIAYAHIVPGVLFLVLAPLQLFRPFRERHYPVHRRLGRVAVSCGLVCGLCGVVFGIQHPFGGALETSAVVVFGGYFVVALATGFLAIRGGDMARHRRWMIRAFALGVAVGSIRLWVGIFEAFAIVRFELGFGIAFWIAFSLHALAAELYLHRRPA